MCSIHEIGQGFISSLFWIERGKECNLSQLEHFVHFIDISLLIKCFSAVKENAHNLAKAWFEMPWECMCIFLVADKSLKKFFFFFFLQVVKGLRYLWELKVMHRGKDMNSDLTIFTHTSDVLSINATLAIRHLMRGLFIRKIRKKSAL